MAARAGSTAKKRGARSARRPSAARRKPGRTSAPTEDVGQTLGELRGLVKVLQASLAEVPKAADFEPLADHLYEFATTAPRLLESLAEIPRAMASVEASVKALHEVAETLQAVHAGFAESLLRVPRAEDYEPLTVPLAEFARVSPDLAASLAEVLRLTRPLAESVRGLRELGEGLQRTQSGLARSLAGERTPQGGEASPPAAASSEAVRELRIVAARLEAARDRMTDAVATIPRDPQYARVAGHLRELAEVSPSLMEWLREVRSLSMPLGDSLRGLEDTARDLTAVREGLLAAIRRLEWPEA